MSGRGPGQRHTFRANAELDPEQQAAHDALAGHDLGVLVAPPGAGKTVACADRYPRRLHPRPGRPQTWRTRTREFLGINAGQRGGGRSKTTGVVDVATLQTLARAEDVADLAAGYTAWSSSTSATTSPPRPSRPPSPRSPPAAGSGSPPPPTDVTSSTTSSACNWARSPHPRPCTSGHAEHPVAGGASAGLVANTMSSGTPATAHQSRS